MSRLSALWKDLKDEILVNGTTVFDGDTELLECRDVRVTELNLDVEEDFFKKEYPEEYTWMHVNFTEKINVEKLGGARSYGWRLYDYDGLDQVRWVEKKLLANRSAKSATITTMWPKVDTSYIPCISLLDFKIRSESLIVSVFARSIDVGKKFPFNVIEIMRVGERVRKRLDCKYIILRMYIASAHVYLPGDKR